MKSALAMRALAGTPREWPISSLGSLLSFLTSGSRGWAEHYVEKGELFLRIQNVGRNKLLLDDVAYVNPPDTAEARRTEVTSGDVLLSITADLGRTAVVPANLGRAFINQHLAILRLKDVEPTYVSAYLASPAGQLQIGGLNRQGVKAGLNFDDVRSIQLPIPPLAEQRRIAAILDHADALRAKRRQALAKLEELTQAIFLEMFGDSKQILANWTSKGLGEALEFLTSGSRGWAAHYSDSGALFLRIQNVRADELVLDDVAYVNAPETAEARRTCVKPGDVLLSITADLGRTAVVPDGLGEAYINQHLSILRSKTLRPRFLSAFLASPLGQRQILGKNRQGVKAGLNFDDIRSLLVPLPPVTLQREFDSRVARVDLLKAAHRSSLSKLDALFASLQQRAFRGEL